MTKNISPHVNIYKFPITAISSITNRLTGVYLSSLFIGAGIYQLTGKDDLQKKYDELGKYKRLFNYSIIFPTTYHTVGGIRHFLWDKYPKYLNNKQVAKSSMILFGFSAVTTVLQEYILC